MDKQVQFFGKTASGIFCQSLFGSAGAFEKTAGAPAFADWANGDRLRHFISKISKKDRQENAYVLVNALGAGEYFGSNINADYFPWNALAHEGDDYGYLTFLRAHAFQHHVNKDPSRAFGRPVLSLLNPQMKRVELIVQLNRQKAKLEGADGIIARIDAGEFPDVSMGCKVPYDICMVCRHASKTKDDYCEHMSPPEHLRHMYGPNKILPNGLKCCVENTHPRFFDISFVFIGADKTAKVMAKLASKGRQVCLGDVCSIGGLSSEIAHRLVQVPEEEPQTVREVAQGYADRIRAAAQEKTAAASCACGCPDDCSELDKLGFAMTGKKPTKTASQQKLGELIKSVPAGAFAMSSLPKLEKDEITISRSALDEMAEHDLGSCCSTAGMMGIVLKPAEFQHIVLVRMGERGLAGELSSKGQVFKESKDFDESVNVDKSLFNDDLKKLLMGLIGQRSGLGSPLRGRMIRLTVASKKPLPTETQVDHPLLSKIGAAYNGYRRSLMKKLSQAEEVIQSDPKLREAVVGSQLVDMFTKTASAPMISLDSLSYFSGVHLQNRDLLFDTPIDVGVVPQSNQA
jgi:hypothetical protein